MGETARDMFDGLKSKLGFDRGEERYDEYDDYGEYAEYDEYAEYGEGYDDRSSVGGYRPLNPQTTRSNRYARSDISSSLVSIDDVKASTPLPDTLLRDPLATSGAGSSRTAGSYVPQSSTMGTSSTMATGSSYGAAVGASPVASAAVPTASSSAGAGSYDPYAAYSSATPSAYAPARSLTVVKPTVYGDVERVARAVKSGDVVVLAMRNTPDDLSKRILDFSFGVASALDANVECPGEKVFAIARGNALTDDEKRRLGAQGVL